MKLNFIIVRYSYSVSDICAYFNNINADVIIINTGNPIEAIYSNVKILNFNNTYREVGAYLKGLSLITMDEESFVLLLNDTIFQNKNFWKLSYIVKSMSTDKFSVPCLYGFSDRSFDIYSNKWFGVPGWHIRSDIFGLNYKGLQLIDDELSIDYIYDSYNNDQFFYYILNDFIVRYHRDKINQMKEFATYFEVFISHFFRENGLIYCILDGRKSVVIRFFHTFISSVRRYFNV
jgi:hypothetical protein